MKKLSGTFYSCDKNGKTKGKGIRVQNGIMETQKEFEDRVVNTDTLTGACIRLKRAWGKFIKIVLKELERFLIPILDFILDIHNKFLTKKK